MATYGQVGSQVGQFAGDVGNKLIQALLGLANMQQLPVQAGMEEGKNIASKSSSANIGEGVNDAVLKALSPYQRMQADIAEKTAKKALTQQAEQVATMPNGAEILASQGTSAITEQLSKNQLMSSPSAGFSNAMSQAQPQQPGQPVQQPTAQPQQAQDIIKSLLGMVYTPSSVDQTGAYQPASLLGGLMRTSGDERVNQQQALNLQPERQLALKKREAEEVPLSKAKREEIGMETQKAILTETLKMEREGSLKPNDIFTKFESASAPFVVVRDAYSRIQEAVKDPSAAGDMATIFSYMKILDPNSTVREGEYATAQNAGSVPQRVWASYNNIVNGKKLSTSQRQDFYKRAGMMFKSAESQQKKTTDEFSAIAKRNGINPSKIIRDTGLKQTSSKQTNNFKVGRFQVEVSNG